ncbi:glutamate mutase L [Desulfosporosinus shakirovi]|uniref:glutamate mutase L n=1 Tax=Desulfosporosinus shakirovi TaxID=2885154 RepID=UPI001E3E6A85|nr:glutamate mutase L [Desulfosporosinus sp. SRJS8]MCB8816017.1 glutamate mutase L [Desulfosporosinus sp. SRJS8]
MPQVDLLVYDVGSTYTKVSAFKRLETNLMFMGRSQAPTTVENIELGLIKACHNLACDLQWDEITSFRTLATSSAAGGLRMVGMGYMPRVTAKAAKEVAMSAGARVLEIISHETPVDFRLEVLQEIKPDIILLAGGTDGGDQDSLLENAEVIVNSKAHSVVIIAGNTEAQAKVEEVLKIGGILTIRVPNVMPTIHELRVKPAREAIHQEFIRQITRARGLGRLLEIVSNGRVIPTPGAVLMGTELLALGTHEKEGYGNSLVIDIGGATTDVHSVLPDLANLTKEETGLVVANEKQLSYRTVEGNLGLRVSATGIVETVGASGVLAKVDLEGEDLAEEIQAYAQYLEKNPGHISISEKELNFDKALAISAIELALKRHAGYFAQSFDPILGIVPGTPVGRDLRKVQRVIAVGGIFAHSTKEGALEILHKSFAKRGISLLPEKPEFVVDHNYQLYTIGAMAEEYPNEALALAENNILNDNKSLN